MPVPHYKQSQPGTCLQASIRMVLASWDDYRHDPSQTIHPQRLSIDGFLIAWTEFDQLCAIIQKSA